MAGDITVCSDTVFKKIVTSLHPIMASAQTSLKIIFPPMPRFINTGCCGDPSHSTNLNEEGHGVRLIEKIVNLRGILKNELNKVGVSNFWLLDGISAVLGIDPKTSRKNNASLVGEVGNVLASDGVHLTGSGYQNVAKMVKSAIEGLVTCTLKKTDISLGDNVSGGQQRRPRTYFWRGFVSQVGCDAAININSAAVRKSSGGKYHRHHPYRKN
jgi:hypothetical protein